MGFFLNLIPYLNLLSGLAALILCGNWLVTGSVQLARYFKISVLIIGLTIVAFGTSAPELFVSIGAALKNSPEISLGNVTGSNIANIALVIGLTSVILPIPVKNKSILFDLIIMLALTVLLYVLGFNGLIGRLEGILLVSILIIYILWSIIKEKRKNKKEEIEKIPDEKIMNPLLALLLAAVSVTGLYFGSEWFVSGAREIAAIWGVSERVIGISVVALGTSMPELVTSVIAALRKEMDISIGNIIGSNIFNIAMVLGTTAIIKPLKTASLSVFTVDIAWVFGISVLLLLAMLPLGKSKCLSEPDKGIISRPKGGVLLVLYAVYIYILFLK